MSSLKDPLLQAKLVSKKQVRRAEHEQRQKRKELGREGVEQEQAGWRAEIEERERLRREEQGERPQHTFPARRMHAPRPAYV